MAGLLLALLVLATGSGAHAMGKPNGTKIQGLAYRGVTAPEARAATSLGEGDRLIGWFPGENTERTALLEITSFREAVVHGTVHDLAARLSRRVKLQPGALAGMRWQTTVCDPRCTPVMYRIASASPDRTSNTMPHASSNRDVWLYEVEFTDRTAPVPDDWKNLCDRRAGARGIFIDGRWHRDGSWSFPGYTFSCPGGVVAKCARGWGYKPWKTLDSTEHGEVSLLPLHLACVRAARADYCGDGISHTQDGTLIDMADRYGFNMHEAIAGFQDESAFGVDGALWVHAPRRPTGRRVASGWLFSTCERPDPERRPISERPLVYVQSKTASRRSHAGD